MKIVARPRQGERVDRPKTWRLYWELPGAGRRQKTETFHGSREDAERRWNAVQAEIDRMGKAYIEPTKMTLSEFLPAWLDDRLASHKIESTTAASYRSIIDTHILPNLGHLPLVDISPAHIEHMFASIVGGVKRKPTSGRQAQYARSILGKALWDAVRMGLMPQNPVRRTERPAHTPRRAQSFTPEQVDALFVSAAKSRILPLLQFAYATGLRRGEILGLTWRDVDLQAGRVIVRQSLTRLSSSSMSVVMKKPKSAAGERVVMLTSQAIEALKAQRREQLKEKAGAAGWYEGDFVFTDLQGRPHNPDNVSDYYRRFRDKAGLPSLPFHSLRHTNVAIRLAAGVPLEVISKQIGHASITVTSRIYSHLLPEADREATNLLDKYLQIKHGV